jgi:hypothetical protein
VSKARARSRPGAWPWLGLAAVVACATLLPLLPAGPALAEAEAVRVAVIGDFGEAGDPARDVADLVKSWNPDFIITTGDNNYPHGGYDTIDGNIGRYYRGFIHPYKGTFNNPSPADTNRFFPTLGNHDWDTDNGQPYLDYFTLPGNERYYSFSWGPLDLFTIDSEPLWPNANAGASAQAQWLEAALEAATGRWQIVYLHHPPYSSHPHAPYVNLRWPYRQWGADAVLAGHDHYYERIHRDDLVYFINGAGGSELFQGDMGRTAGSYRLFRDDYGAMLIEADDARAIFRFITRRGRLIDTFILFTPTHFTFLPVARR